MVVYVPVDRQGPPIGKRRQEALDLSSHLHSKLSAQPRSAFSRKSVCPECSEPSTESAAAGLRANQALAEAKGASPRTDSDASRPRGGDDGGVRRPHVPNWRR